MNTPSELTLEQVLQICSSCIEFASNYPRDANSFGTDNSVLHVAVFSGNARFVRVLIENGAKVNCRGDMGNTALHDAVARNENGIIELLVHAGADVTIKNEFGETPLDAAKKRGMKRTINLMKQTQSGRRG